MKVIGYRKMPKWPKWQTMPIGYNYHPQGDYLAIQGDVSTAPEQAVVGFLNPFPGVLNTVVKLAQIYHGYKRNKSVLWALGWFCVPTLIGAPLMLAQGFAKPKGR